MAQDEQPPGGLLSKVVKFVRNPTVNWSDLDQPEDKESHYSKQMLKEMIERKRANDFVRRREFDQLRKLRQRSALGMGGTLDAAGRPSFFQSSLPSEPGDRAGTLKKIDEIEAQMSRHWRRNNDQDPSQAPSAPPPDPDAGFNAAQHARQYATTVHADLPGASFARDTDFAATDISPMEPARAAPLAALDDDLELDWPTGPAQQGAVAEAVAHDPALEEAAIRWANGDVAGTEAALTALLGANPQATTQESAWMALFDVYRATDQRGRFEAQAAAFAVRLGRAAPQWSVAAPKPGQVDPQAPDAADAVAGWVSPTSLDAEQARALQAMLESRQPTVLDLDWSHLGAIEDGALEPLVAQFTAWTQQKIKLRSLGGAGLDGLLRARTVSGERMVSALWWQLRMAWLRVTGRPDEFDLVALDYCVTYEVLPPAWRDALCDFIALDAPVVPASRPAAGLAAVGALSGVVVGDAGDQLAAFDTDALAAALVVVDCSALVRIDFAAAGSVLNWTVAQQAAGRRAQFRAMPRLVATFFNVVGVGEHADILSRRD